MGRRLLRGFAHRTGHAVLHFLLVNRFAQRFKRLFDGMAFIDAVGRANAPRLGSSNRVGRAPKGYGYQGE